MQEIFLGRQPILDRNQDLVAFELLFRSGQNASANVTDDVAATASVIVNAYGELGIESVLGRHRGFINVSSQLLMDDMIHFLPRAQVVLEILETVEITDEVVRRCIELKEMGYHLALDDVTEANDRIRPLLPIVDMVKVDLLRLETGMLSRAVDSFKPWPLMLVAEKVDSAEQADLCMALGFQMFQGYYFARPQVISGKSADPSKLALLRLLTLTMGDTEVAVIEQEFKHHPNLAYNLMRLVNSAACGLPQKINSLKHGIVLLGRKQLQRWVQLLLYTTGRSKSAFVNPLLQMAATRGKLMEHIAEADRPRDKDYHDRAFMVGILSLLDTLLGMPLAEIVDYLNLADELKAALLERQGHLGRLLALLEKKEANDVAAVQDILGELAFMGLGELITAELDAVNWANRIGETAH